MTRELQTSSKQKALSQRERARGGWRGERRERGRKGGGEGGFSRFIARSREASMEHSFNQTVTSPPGAAQRLENRSLLGSLPCLPLLFTRISPQQRVQRRQRRACCFISMRVRDTHTQTHTKERDKNKSAFIFLSGCLPGHRAFLLTNPPPDYLEHRRFDKQERVP